MTEIRVIQNNDYIDEDIFLSKMSLLGLEEKEAVMKYKLPKDRARSLAGYLLLNEMTGLTPAFSKGPHGKKYILGEDVPFFSLSHSGDLSACAVSDREVGIDIQMVKDVRPSLAARICLEDEMKYPPLDVWSAKEAYVKLTGEGLYRSFDSFRADIDEGKVCDLSGNELARITRISLPEGYTGFCAELL